MPRLHARPKESETTIAHFERGQLCDALAEARRGGVGVQREQDERVRALGVRGVDTRGGAHEPVLRLGDDERRTCTEDGAALSQDHLDSPRVPVSRELACASRRFDPGQVDDATLHLRDGLLGDDEHVVRLEPARSGSGIDDQPAEVVALLELRDPDERDDAQLARQAMPVTRIPACAR